MVRPSYSVCVYLVEVGVFRVSVGSIHTMPLLYPKSVQECTLCNFLYYMVLMNVFSFVPGKFFYSPVTLTALRVRVDFRFK